MKKNVVFFSYLRSLNFCPDFFGYVGKRLDKKAKVNIKICVMQLLVSQFLKKF